MKKITNFQYSFMEKKLKSFRNGANEKVRQGTEVFGTTGDGHLDEIYQLSMRETWLADKLANELQFDIDQCSPIKPEEQDQIVQIGNAVIFENETVLIIDNIARARGVVSNSSLYGKKCGDIIGKLKIQKILPPSEAEKIFWEKNKEYSNQ